MKLMLFRFISLILLSRGEGAVDVISLYLADVFENRAKVQRRTTIAILLYLADTFEKPAILANAPQCHRQELLKSISEIKAE